VSPGGRFRGVGVKNENSSKLHPSELTVLHTSLFRLFLPWKYKKKVYRLHGEQKIDACRTRTCAPEGNRFLVYRYNHSAKAPRSGEIKVSTVYKLSNSAKHVRSLVIPDLHRSARCVVEACSHFDETAKLCVMRLANPGQQRGCASCCFQLPRGSRAFDNLSP
jgi:hypothetical protein